jgi:predicted DNA-binding protein
MNNKEVTSRITIDLPTNSHKKLKATAAILGKSMREFVIESIEKHLNDSNTLNKETLKAINNVDLF